MNIGKERIRTGKEAQFRKMPLQQLVLKKPTVMYRYKKFIQEMNVEKQELFCKRKINTYTILNTF